MKGAAYTGCGGLYTGTTGNNNHCTSGCRAGAVPVRCRNHLAARAVAAAAILLVNTLVNAAARHHLPTRWDTVCVCTAKTANASSGARAGAQTHWMGARSAARHTSSLPDAGPSTLTVLNWP